METDFLKLKYDYIEYYVGMAKMVVYWHVKALGFKVIAYSGPETGVEDRFSYYIVKNDIKLVITSASQPSSYKIVSFVDLHGNGIKRVAIKVSDVSSFFTNAIANGAIPLQKPTINSDKNGSVEQASIKIFDDNEILLVNYDKYNGDFMPGYVNVEKDWQMDIEDSCLETIDHVACVLRPNETKIWEEYFNSIFNFNTVGKFGKEEMKEAKLGMSLKVLQSQNKLLNKVLVEPDQSGMMTQVQLFIDQNYGAGIQHLAFSTDNIFRTIEVLRKNGVRFNSYPNSYYEKLAENYPELDVENLKKHGILCDVEDGSLLLQIFTMPLGDRSTFFYEVVQRVNRYEGFGLGNIKALFDSMETE